MSPVSSRMTLLICFEISNLAVLLFFFIRSLQLVRRIGLVLITQRQICGHAVQLLTNCLVVLILFVKCVAAKD